MTCSHVSQNFCFNLHFRRLCKTVFTYILEAKAQTYPCRRGLSSKNKATILICSFPVKSDITIETGEIFIISISVLNNVTLFIPIAWIVSVIS